MINTCDPSLGRRVDAFLHSLWPVVVLLACQLGLGLSAAHRKSPTFDEGLHLASGYSYWSANDYRMNAESGNLPQRWAALPIWLEGYRFPPLDDPGWVNGDRYEVANRFLFESGNDTEAMLFQSRAMIGLLSVGLGVLIYCWSRQLFGGIGGLISLTLYVFSPTVLSNGFLVTSDLASALFFSAAIWVAWALLHRISVLTMTISAFALAGLILSKFSGLLILPMALLLVLARLCSSAPLVVKLGRRFELRGRAKQMAAFLGAALVQVVAVCCLIWAPYGFRYEMKNHDAQSSDSFAALWSQAKDHLGAVTPVIVFCREHQLLPEPFLYGIVYTLHTSEARQAFFNGAFNNHGKVFFFPYCFAVKTPLEVFLILVLAAVGAWLWRGRGGAEQTSERSPFRGGFYAVAPLLVLLGVYWAASLVSHLNIGQRHLLPVYPPMFVLAGAAACWFRPGAISSAGVRVQTENRVEATEPPRLGSKMVWTARALVIGGLVLAACEVVWIWPDYLAYFNILAGGPAQGYRHLVDSSLDWGQDLKELKQWLDAHPQDAEPAARVYFSYFGSVSPQYYGIQAIRLPGFFDFREPKAPVPLTGGTYCISATMLAGIEILFPGKWNQLYENMYQDLRQEMQAYEQAKGNSDAVQQIVASVGARNVEQIFQLYEHLRFARLCSFLRQREPDANVGYSILIYLLSDADVQRATEGAAVELLSDSEPGTKECLPVRIEGSQK